MMSIAQYRSLFPIDSIQKVVALFEKQLASGDEPDLAFCSIVVGAIENELTSGKTNTGTAERENSVGVDFPRLEFDAVAALHERFRSLVAGAVEARLLGGITTSRELVKRVSDVIWNSLTRSYYKDRAHLQSVYSFLTGNKLDCFGVAFAVTAGCQALGCRDVHLALSEDHAWVVFGKDGSETAEVTWHGKGNEDKRGQEIGAGVLSGSWLYVAGHPVVCTREMELAALVSSINPTLTATTDAHEVAFMQQQLLWLLYDMGHLKSYPMALGNLGDLQEYNKISDTKSRPDCTQLYAEAIASARKNYANRHVYPYTFQGGYYHRHKMYKEAFDSWANAGEVIRQYNYSREDEEIYKEFAEIANELIPQLMKAESSGHSARSILKDPQCFASLLRFYDGICKWEEGSQTPILHIGWAKPLVNTISKFEADVRAQVNILCHEEAHDENSESKKEKDIKKVKSVSTIKKNGTTKSENNGENKNENGKPKEETNNDSANNNSEPDGKVQTKEENDHKPQDTELSVHDQMEAAINSHPTITLYSHKMKGLKNLLLAEKLNTHAISLHLTAQSQVHINKRARGDNSDSPVHCARPKRVRRDH